MRSFIYNVFLVISCAIFANGLKKTDLALLDKAILSLLNENPPVLVRLAFHDCVGGCNGCINLDNPDNGGLFDFVTQLEAAYQKYNLKKIISRADFWAYAGQAAVLRSIQNVDGVTASMLGFKFQTGRKDCATAPKTTENVHLPGPHMTYAALTSFYATKFKMTEMQAVAIMGAHTLGQSHLGNSGFKGTWTNGGDLDFDNGYYKNLLKGNWVQRNVGLKEPKLQWNSPNGIMLNSDMCLMKDIKLEKNGKSLCNFKTCAISGGAKYVEMFAKDQKLWLKEFGKAFNLMQSAGAVNLTDLTN